MDQLGDTIKENKGEPILVMKDLGKSYQLGSHELKVLDIGEHGTEAYTGFQIFTTT